MPKLIRSKKQAASDKRAIKKLRDLGIIKADIRKKPTPAVKRALKKYADVVSGKAAVVTPKNPKSYKKLYRTVGNKVIVPRRKGERITVNKSGEITGTRKVGGRTVRTKFKHVPSNQGEKIKRPKKANTQFAIPFLRGGGEVQWMRFPNYDELKKFMEGYNYKDWPDYVVEENIDDEDDEALTEKLERKRARIEKRKLREWEKQLQNGLKNSSSKSAAGRKRKGR